MIRNWVDPFLVNFFDEEWAKPVPSVSDRFMADITASFMKKIFHIVKRERKSDIHHNGKADNLR
jgi:hypothetical protein